MQDILSVSPVSKPLMPRTSFSRRVLCASLQLNSWIVARKYVWSCAQLEECLQGAATIGKWDDLYAKNLQFRTDFLLPPGRGTRKRCLQWSSVNSGDVWIYWCWDVTCLLSWYCHWAFTVHSVFVIIWKVADGTSITLIYIPIRLLRFSIAELCCFQWFESPLKAIGIWRPGNLTFVLPFRMLGPKVSMVAV